MLRPSRIVAESLEINPFGIEKATRDTVCSLCGFPIKKGEELTPSPLKGLSLFTDEHAMACRSSKVGCKWCTPFVKKGLSKSNMAAVANKVHTQKGSYLLNTDAQRTWFFLTPPPPPYVACINTGNVMHHAWCTPVTLDNEQISIKVDKQILTIRHSRLLEALQCCQDAAEILSDVSDNKKANYTHPYRRLDRNLKNIDHGKFGHLAEQIAITNPNMKEILNFLKRNTLGETWALASIAKKKQEKPVQQIFIPK